MWSADYTCGASHALGPPTKSFIQCGMFAEPACAVLFTCLGHCLLGVRHTGTGRVAPSAFSTGISRPGTRPCYKTRIAPETLGIVGARTQKQQTQIQTRRTLARFAWLFYRRQLVAPAAEAAVAAARSPEPPVVPGRSAAQLGPAERRARGGSVGGSGPKKGAGAGPS